jgi:hypothetical protein
MRRAEREGLIRGESLDLFLMWRSLGGLNQGISLTELLEVPGWIIQDFVWLLGQQRKARKRKKRRDKARKEGGRAAPTGK